MNKRKLDRIFLLLQLPLFSFLYHSPLNFSIKNKWDFFRKKVTVLAGTHNGMIKKNCSFILYFNQSKSIFPFRYWGYWVRMGRDGGLVD
jgi:hypothetical protein